VHLDCEGGLQEDDDIKVRCQKWRSGLRCGWVCQGWLTG
jgi:hypothetical protein